MRRAAITAAVVALSLVIVAPSIHADDAVGPAPTGALKWQQFSRQIADVHPVFTARHEGNVGLMWLDPTVLRFRLIPGTTAPEKSPVRGIDNRPSTWVPKLVAAFNGGFLLKDEPGGYFYNGTTVKPMVNGMASMVITKDGGFDVIVWRKQDRITKDVLAVRQNWEPLIVHGNVRSNANDPWYRWGGTDGNSPLATRSAVGVTKDGGVVYAFCNNCVAHELGVAMAKGDVETAMILDMNKSWPNGFYYSAPKRKGKPPVGHRVHPDQWRTPGEYLYRGSKDIIVADAISPTPAPTPVPTPTPTPAPAQ